jgi:general secretion pathway protein B
MSYILDALRRADAERSRGAVPGLHAHNVPADGEPAARNFNPLIWAAGAVGMLLVAVVCILVFGPWKAGAPAGPDARVALAPAPELAPTPRDGAPAQPAQGELPPPQSGAIDPGARPIEPPIVRSNPPSAYPPLPVPRGAAHEPLAERAAAGRVATLEPRADARLPAPAAAPAPPGVEHYGAPMAAASAPAPARSNAIVNINDLPPNVRSQLPRLTVGGAIYSDTPSARMVILNGQVFHEGDKPAADTMLEQIRLKSAVLNFRGQRYEVSF